MFFFVLFCCFCRIWLIKCPQTENKKEQKRSCRRENRKMSFVFFVVGPPPPQVCLLLCIIWCLNHGLAFWVTLFCHVTTTVVAMATLFDHVTPRDSTSRKIEFQESRSGGAEIRRIFNDGSQKALILGKIS